MPYNPSFALTNSQQRNQGVRTALDDFMSYFKQLRASKDETEKEAVQKAITDTSAQASGATEGAPRLGMDATGMPLGLQGKGVSVAANPGRKLAELKAAYINKYGQEPASAEDFLAKDAARQEQLAGLADKKTERANKSKFVSGLSADPSLSDTEKGFYGFNPAAYGDRLKPTAVTYLPTDQGFIPAPSKLGGGASPTPPAAGPLQIPGGAIPKPISHEPPPVRWVDKVDEQGNVYQLNPVTGETRNTDRKAQMKPGAVTIDPQALADKAQQGMDLIDQMIGNPSKNMKPHPGFTSAVGSKGFASALGLLKDPLPGTDAADFNALYNQVGGQAFLDARQQLKGGGAITDMEGNRAQQAITRMQTSQSEDAFIKAAKEYRDILQTAHDRALSKTKTGDSAGNSGATGQGPKVGDTKINNIGIKVRWNGSAWEHAG